MTNSGHFKQCVERFKRTARKKYKLQKTNGWHFMNFFRSRLWRVGVSHERCCQKEVSKVLNRLNSNSFTSVKLYIRLDEISNHIWEYIS